MGHPGHEYVSRIRYYAVDPFNLDLGNGGAPKTRPTAWAHNGRTRTTYTDQTGEASAGGDGIRRESETQTVVVGSPLGRPSSPWEALMVSKPTQSL